MKNGKIQYARSLAMRGPLIRRLVVYLATFALVAAGGRVSAEPPPPGTPSGSGQPASDAPAGPGMVSLTRVAPSITPYSDYRGDFFDRTTLTGDWGGARTDLYERGITFDVILTQTYQNVASGGVNGYDDTYTGLLDYGVTFDTGKLDLWPGGLFTFNAQTGFAANNPLAAGTVSPTNFISEYPTPEKPDTFLMEYYWTQALTEEVVAIVGRINATNFLDRNRFADNPRNQFMNLAMNNSPLLGSVVSFSTYGVLLSWQVTENLTINPAIYDPNVQPGDWGSSSDRGFFADVGVGVEFDFAWTLDEELDGALRVDGIYVTADKTALDNPRLLLDGLLDSLLLLGIPMETKPDSWLVNVNFEQFIWKLDKKTGRKGLESPDVTRLRSAAFDFQEPGLGVFGKFAVAPGDRNPWNLYLMGGVGGRGVIPMRPYDRVGVGAYWLKRSDDIDQALRDLIEDEVGLEVFYNVAIVPSVQLTFDLQWINSGIRTTDDAVVFGMRLMTPF